MSEAPEAGEESDNDQANLCTTCYLYRSLGPNAAALIFIGDKGQGVNSLIVATHFRHSLGKFGWSIVDSERLHDRTSLHRPKF